MQEEAPGPAARRGRELERLARQAYEREVDIQMEPLCLVHDELEWMRASLDGLSFDGATALEIKCPTNVRDQSAAKAGSVTLHYYAQLQHELEVSRAAKANYWTFDDIRGTLINQPSASISTARQASGCRGRILSPAGSGQTFSLSGQARRRRCATVGSRFPLVSEPRNQLLPLAAVTLPAKFVIGHPKVDRMLFPVEQGARLEQIRGGKCVSGQDGSPSDRQGRMAATLRSAGMELQFSRNDVQVRRVVSVVGATHARKTASVAVSNRQ